jgi:predicted N-acyltransferase
MRARIHDRIGMIDPACWDGVGDDPLSAHAVLSALEGCGMDGVRMCYVILEEGARPAAAIPFARLPIDAARLTRGLFRSGIEITRTLAPRFMRTSLALCGTPLSVANPPLRIARGVDAAAVWREAAGLLREFARDEGCPWCVFKEIDADDPAASSTLSSEGWTVVPSEPNCRLTVRWHRFDGYLASLRHPYRAKIRRSATKLQRAGVALDVAPLQDRYGAAEHRLYENVLDRAAVRLERLTPSFFTRLGAALADRVWMIRFHRDGRLIGWVVLLIDRDRAHDLFHGIDYDENAAVDLYFNQLAETIRFAIDRRARTLSLGQSTETAKTRFGAEIVPLAVALRHRSAAVHAALSRLSGPLFPQKRVIERRTFHARGGSGEAPR